MQHIRLSALFSLLALLILTGCHSSKKSTSTVTEPGATSDVIGAYRTVTSGYTPWEAVSVPVAVQLREPVSFRISGTMTMKRGEYIHFSARVLGIEMGAVMITRDSIFAKEKLHKTYVAESLSAITGKFPATVGDLQQLILGHIFMIGKPDLSRAASDFDFESYPGFWTATASMRGQSYTFTVDGATGNLQMLSAEIADKYPVTAEYADFTSTPAGQAAREVTVKASTAKRKAEAEFSLNYSKARWTGVSEKSWETPRGYKKISASTLLKSLSNL